MKYMIKMYFKGKYERICRILGFFKAWLVLERLACSVHLQHFLFYVSYAKLVLSTVLFKPNDAIQTTHNENKQVFNSAVAVYLVVRH